MANSGDPASSATNGRVRRGAPCLWFTRLPLRELAAEIRAIHFPRSGGANAPRVQFAIAGRLAEFDDDGAVTITFHQVLNQATTPVEVFGTLIKRALWRSEGRADGPNGPGFCTICPEEPFAEAWLEHHLGHGLARRDGDGADGEVEVGSKWRDAWLAPRGPAPRLALARSLADAELVRLLRQIAGVSDAAATGA